jgi:hypothetical protein
MRQRPLERLQQGLVDVESAAVDDQARLPAERRCRVARDAFEMADVRSWGGQFVVAIPEVEVV